MPWVRVDDHFDEHPKMARVGPPAWGYWVAGLAYCNRNLTDGFIPFSVAYNLGSWKVWDAPDESGREKIWTYAVTSGMGGDDLEGEWIVERLVDAGLWDQVPGGYQVHDFLDYNPSKASVLAERKKWADKKKSRGESKGESKGESERPVPVPVPNKEDVLRNAREKRRPRGTLEPVSNILPRVNVG